MSQISQVLTTDLVTVVQKQWVGEPDKVGRTDQSMDLKHVTGGLGNFGRLGSERRSQSLEMVELESSRRRGEAEEDQVVNVR